MRRPKVEKGSSMEESLETGYTPPTPLISDDHIRTSSSSLPTMNFSDRFHDLPLILRAKFHTSCMEVMQAHVEEKIKEIQGLRIKDVGHVHVIHDIRHELDVAACMGFDVEEYVDRLSKLRSVSEKWIPLNLELSRVCEKMKRSEKELGEIEKVQRECKKRVNDEYLEFRKLAKEEWRKKRVLRHREEEEDGEEEVRSYNNNNNNRRNY